jgi:hypothetical protein
MTDFFMTAAAVAPVAGDESQSEEVAVGLRATVRKR